MTATPESQENASESYTLVENPEFAGFQSVEITKIDESKPWKPALEVAVTLADGSRKEGVAADTPFFTFESKDGEKLTVSAASAGHIQSLHIKGEDLGSKFSFSSLKELLASAAERIPKSVSSEPGVLAFDIEMGQPMGKEGLAGMHELVADGTLTVEDVRLADTVREEVSQLNRGDNADARQAFVDRFKSEHPDSKIQFQVVRNAVVVPVVAIPKRETTKLFMVFGPGTVAGEKTLYTTAPGRNMPPHPNPNQMKDEKGNLDEAKFRQSSNAWFDTVMLTGE